ncbi:MAG: hypothetical protein ACI9DG_002388, partial [Oleispira sp.]
MRGIIFKIWSKRRMFEVGQRWISDTESDLGLGMVQEV